MGGGRKINVANLAAIYKSAEPLCQACADCAILQYEICLSLLGELRNGSITFLLTWQQKPNFYFEHRFPLLKLVTLWLCPNDLQPQIKKITCTQKIVPWRAVPTLIEWANDDRISKFYFVYYAFLSPCRCLTFKTLYLKQ